MPQANIRDVGAPPPRDRSRRSASPHAHLAPHVPPCNLQRLGNPHKPRTIPCTTQACGLGNRRSRRPFIIHHSQFSILSLPYRIRTTPHVSSYLASRSNGTARSAASHSGSVG